MLFPIECLEDCVKGKGPLEEVGRDKNFYIFKIKDKKGLYATNYWWDQYKTPNVRFTDLEQLFLDSKTQPPFLVRCFACSEVTSIMCLGKEIKLNIRN